MEYKIRGKKVKITDDMKDYVETKLSKLDKYLNNPENFTATVLFKMEGVNTTVEVTIPTKRMILRAEESNKDPFAATDLVLDKLDRQIRKNKTRMNKKVNKDRISDLVTDFDGDEVKDTSKVVKRKEIELKPMSEEEAILQMNLIDHDFFLFKNEKTGDAEVIYKRKDKNYGIIKEK